MIRESFQHQTEETTNNLKRRDEVRNSKVIFEKNGESKNQLLTLSVTSLTSDSKHIKLFLLNQNSEI
ncbi:hypothetical protein HHI36_014297 [Cryptolaemus montrouzieri]|uniref:Uncharacterized protein n=1 Tax=Cryptolaemus montrouzieri TaxID=559131 RepID=A0ABD2N2R8_9CUCU